LTLSPALCAIFLKPHAGHGEEHKKNIMQRFFTNFNTAFTATTMKYTHGVSFLEKEVAYINCFIRFCRVIWLVDGIYTKSICPSEDMGGIFSDIALPLGASQERTEEVLSQIEKVVSKMPEVDHIMKISGRV
jgi:HAE1 family hydrophobic/amphiphilic exporter-1